MKVGPDLETFAQVASELSDRLATSTTAVRKKVTEQLDEDAPMVLRGDDYVAAAEARLRAMAADATSARSQGLVVVSETPPRRRDRRRRALDAHAAKTPGGSSA